jgi:drug/metabolite transporter (DMT)-like permease
VDRPPLPPWRSPTIVGVLCGLGAAFAWAAGFAAARHGVQNGLAPADIAFHRFVWVGALLLPVVWRQNIATLGGVGWRAAIVLAIFAGPVQGILSASGFVLAPLAHGALIQPSNALLGGLLMATLILGEPLRPRRLVGAAVIIAGLVLLGTEALKTLGPHALIGDLIFVAAGMFWAFFTILVRLWRITASQATLAIGAVSLVLYAPVYAALVGFERMIAAGLWENLLQIAVQGLLAGALAIHLASRSVILLGAGRASAFPAMVPPATLLIGAVLLGEVPTLVQLLGLAVIALGFRFVLKN